MLNRGTDHGVVNMLCVIYCFTVKMVYPVCKQPDGGTRLGVTGRCVGNKTGAKRSIYAQLSESR